MPGTPVRRHLPTWDEVAAAADTEWCDGAGCGFDKTLHANGMEWGCVHWSDRVVTRRGIRKFLSLAYESSKVTLGTPRWKVLWQRARWIRSIERVLHVDVTSTTDQVINEKSAVRFYLRDPAWRTDPDAKKAWAWANGPTGERRKR